MQTAASRDWGRGQRATSLTRRKDYKSAAFSSKEDQILLELVCKNQPKYDARLESYKRITVKENISEEILCFMMI